MKVIYIYMYTQDIVSRPSTRHLFAAHTAVFLWDMSSPRGTFLGTRDHQSSSTEVPKWGLSQNRPPPNFSIIFCPPIESTALFEGYSPFSDKAQYHILTQTSR